MQVPIDHNTTLGALFIGLIAASIIYGVTCLQAYTYFHIFRSDRLLFKYAVATLIVLDSFHLGAVIHTVYYYTITSFGGFFAIEFLTVSMKLAIQFNIIVIIAVQSLYAARVWILCGYHRGLFGYLVVGVVVSAATIGLVFTAIIWTCKTYVDVNNSSWWLYASLASATVVDFCIAYAMCSYLYKTQRSLVAHGDVNTRLRSKISSMMQYILSSGLLTSACSMVCLISYILAPDTFIFVGVGLLLTKLYTTSFLAMLNARDRIDGGTTEGDLSTGSTFTATRSSPSQRRARPLRLGTKVTVHNSSFTSLSSPESPREKVQEVIALSPIRELSPVYPAYPVYSVSMMAESANEQ